jgi:hypothetical protein
MHGCGVLTAPRRFAQVHNNERNVQLLVSSLQLSVRWSADVGPEPPTPVSNVSRAATDAAVARRGPLLFAHRPAETRTVVTTYDKDLPARPQAVDFQMETADPCAP